MDNKEQTTTRKHTLKEWIIAVRPWSFPASTMPVIVTVAYLYWTHHDINWVNGVWALLNIILFHAAGNTRSDYFDFKTGVDAKDTYGFKILTDGVFTPRQIIRLSLGLLVVAVVAGIGLWARTGIVTLYIGALGFLSVLCYPPLKYRAWGDVVIFIVYALLPIVGTCYVATGAVHWSVLWLALPVGLITVAILHANNTRDIRTDRRASIRTIAMNIGTHGAMYLYCAEVLLPFLWTAACIVAGVFPLWTLLVLVALVPAAGNVRAVLQLARAGEQAIARLDEHTAQLQLQFSLLMTCSFILAALV
ncbi:MAG: prenyltransferase [Prevotellaceae bacterium]|nr:prenyltransferase [Prevotellaceae bacterium]